MPDVATFEPLLRGISEATGLDRRLLAVGLLLVLGGLGHLLLGLFYGRLHRVARLSANRWDDAVIDQDRTLIVNFVAFGASSLDFFVYTFTRTTNWVEYHAVKQEILLKILDIIHANGADVAFPTQTLHLQPAVGESGQ